MTSSDGYRAEARRIVQSLQATLASSPLGVAIDDPVDAVFETPVEERPGSAREVIECVAKRVQAASAGLRIAARSLSMEHARDEATVLISSCYGHHDGTGFEAGLLDAVDTQFAGMEQLCRKP